MLVTTVVISVSFAVVLAVSLYLSQSSSLGSSDGSDLYPYIVGVLIGSVILKLIWPLLTNNMRVYCALAPAVLTSFTLYLQMTALAYTETLLALNHLQRLATTTLTISECLNNETIRSLHLINKSLFQLEQISEVKSSIEDVTDYFEKVNDNQIRFKDSLMAIVEWWDTTSMSCDKVKSRPYEACRMACERAKVNCYNEGFAFLCNIVDLAKSVCEVINFDSSMCSSFRGFVYNSLDWLKDVVVSIIDQFIRMRIGIRFSLQTSSEVENQFNTAWIKLKEDMVQSSRTLVESYLFMRKVISYSGVFIITTWPLTYMVRYHCASLSFDNKRKRPFNVREVVNAVFMVDVIIIATILLLDLYLTRLFHECHLFIGDYFRSSSGKLFEIKLKSNSKGLERIMQMMLQQLDRLQSAAQLDRIVACVVDPPVIDYNYTVYYVVGVLRLIFVGFRMKLPHYASMICGEFFPDRRHLRAKHLRATVLMEDRYREVPLEIVGVGN